MCPIYSLSNGADIDFTLTYFKRFGMEFDWSYVIHGIWPWKYFFFNYSVMIITSNNNKVQTVLSGTGLGTGYLYGIKYSVRWAPTRSLILSF